MVPLTRFIQQKKERKPITMLTAYSFGMARMLDELGVDIVLVGDSLANVFCGYETTVSVTLDQMLYHTKLVSRAVSKALVVGDMPFLSYQVSLESARLNAGRFIQEAGAHAVKMEVGPAQLDAVKAVVDIGVPVMAHIGLRPQHVYQTGYRAAGKTPEEAEVLLQLAMDLQAAGCFSIVLEVVPPELARQVSQAVAIPIIGIGSGPECDGQVLVTDDILGLTPGKRPSFVRTFADLQVPTRSGISAFLDAVRGRSFP